jgi:Uncharacterized conserved protein
MKVTPSTIRKWKAQDKWDNELKGSAPKSKRSAPKRSRGQPGGQLGNKNASGHGAPLANQNATKFGFFSKYLPAESVEIMQNIQDRSPEDMIWDQIMIQYTAIIRAQKIMLVQDHDDLTKELKRKKDSDTTEEREYELQFAWDKQANFLMAQTKAMAELRNLIKQFVSIADEQDERRKKLELMQARIDQIRASTDTGINTEDNVGSLLDKLEEAFRDEPE